MTEKRLIKIPSGEYCDCCPMLRENTGVCYRYSESLRANQIVQEYLKCDACKEKRPIEVRHE